MNLFKVVALPALFLTLQYQDLYSKDKLYTPMEEWQAPKPQQPISFGKGIDIIVKGLDLNINHIRFIKAPQATDYFKHANNKAVYAPSLIIAANNGINSGRDLNPASPVTRGQFALALYEAITATGQYPVNMMWLNIKDEAAFSAEILSAVQTLIKFNVVALEKGNFRPKAYITEAEATKMVKNAAAFIQSHKAHNANVDKGDAQVTFTTTPVNNKVNSIVITAAGQPDSGYRLVITSIDFTETATAVIHYKITKPAEGSMNLQVISAPTAETFIPVAYKAVLQGE